MSWYHIVFLVLLNPWVLLLILAVSVALYSASAPDPTPTDAEVKAYKDKVLKELGAKHSAHGSK